MMEAPEPAAPFTPIAGPTSDLVLAIGGSVAALLAVSMAVRSWVTSEFAYQECIIRE